MEVPQILFNGSVEDIPVKQQRQVPWRFPQVEVPQLLMTSAVLVMAGPIELFPDIRQLTLWSSCSTTIALSRPPSTGRFSNGNSNLENTLVVDVDDQSTVGREEGTAQQMAHTSSLRLVHRELTERVIIFTAGSMHEQFHCAERLF